MNVKYKSLFFDLDDTLWDTARNNRECLEEIFRDYSFDKYYESFETFYDAYMPYNLSLWAKYRKGMINRWTLITERLLYILRPMGIDDVDYALRINDDYLQRTTTKTAIIPGSIELLESLHTYYRLFILSNGFREIQSLKMQNSRLLPYFERLILSEDADIQKPNKGIFDFALKNTNSRRNESLMIGDSWDADIVGAHNARIDQLWFNPQRLPAQGFEPTFEVVSLGEIAGILM